MGGDGQAVDWSELMRQFWKTTMDLGYHDPRAADYFRAQREYRLSIAPRCAHGNQIGACLFCREKEERWRTEARRSALASVHPHHVHVCLDQPAESVRVVPNRPDRRRGRR